MRKITQKIEKRLLVGFLTGVLALSQGFWGPALKASDENTQQTSTQSKQYDGLIKIKSYDELVKRFNENGMIVDESRFLRNKGVMLYDTADSTASSNEAPMATAEAAAGSESSYSTTNVQVEGVDEADTLKNDGRYIYQTIASDKIAIVDTKGQLKTLSIIKAKENRNITFDTMFLDGNQLIVVAQRYQIGNPGILESKGKVDTYALDYIDPHKYFSMLQVYDVSDKTAPKLTREIEIEGSTNQVRKIDDTVYLLTRKYTNYLIKDHFTKEDVLPVYKDSLANNEEKTILPENIWYQPWGNVGSYTILTAMKLGDKKPMEVQAVLGEAGQVYMNKNALYLTSPSYFFSSDVRTYISKFAVDKQKVTYLTSGCVMGTLLNQFSMDEYKGKFRVATTTFKGNALYVLDEQMKTIGSLNNLAPGERIYSVRFDGEKGYVVTFKQVDPLFVIDLSSPTSPKVLGELKIPGFSQYLHPIGENLVVGIGRSTSDIIRRDENGKEVVTGVTAAGIKLSLFDVSNPKSPKEINHIILGTSGSYSAATDNHKAVTIHKQKQLLAIPIFIDFDQEEKMGTFDGAYVFGIENGKLVGKAKLGKIDSTYRYYQGTERVCYIGDKLYFLYDNKINAYELDNYKRIQTLNLD